MSVYDMFHDNFKYNKKTNKTISKDRSEIESKPKRNCAINILNK